MKSKPVYFEAIRQQAAKRWEQLEGDAELAGPWRLLFKQVQSPQHILSELLQNADDAGATAASVKIENRIFTFSHNGEDFTEEQFASLCRFGYSNKRALHTIGFRGIGFKSTFSLGGRVELHTPSLSVAFDCQRFTEPVWIEPMGDPSSLTHVRVCIIEELRQRELEKNLQEWLKSSLSLLFFLNIRSLSVDNQEVHWVRSGPGPVAGTEWMALEDKPCLVVRSELEAFPADCMAEILDERLLQSDDPFDFPPCRVELVLGQPGRLFVVLPTGVETGLPFACNAPFVQDPARLKIKDPELSPTNRWLLRRIGELAASVMLEWLQQTCSPTSARADAYDFFPPANNRSAPLERACTSIVADTTIKAVTSHAFLLTETGELVGRQQSILIPPEVAEIWPLQWASKFIDPNSRPPFSPEVARTNALKLIHRNLLTEMTKVEIVEALRTKNFAKPSSWPALLKLWAYIAPEISKIGAAPTAGKEFRIVPVAGRLLLCSANLVVRLDTKTKLHTDADWDFLEGHLQLVDRGWLEFLDENGCLEPGATSRVKDLDKALEVQRIIGLNVPAKINSVMDKVATKLCQPKVATLPNCIRLAQIAAKLDLYVSKLHFVTMAQQVKSTVHELLYDEDGTLEEILPAEWAQSHLLHAEYSGPFSSCTAEEWSHWVHERADIKRFASPSNIAECPYGDPSYFLRQRGYLGAIVCPYVSRKFRTDDWDFSHSHWTHWQTLAKESPTLWVRLMTRILLMPESFWTETRSAQLHQRASSTKNWKSVTQEGFLARWIFKFRDLPCLLDTQGNCRKPTDLLLHTPETEALTGIEPFLSEEMDTPATRPFLKLLGVRDKATDPKRLLDRLRALSRAKDPPALEVDKLYHALDLMLDECSAGEMTYVKSTLQQERVVLTEDSGWATAGSVFRPPEGESVPGFAVVRNSVRELALWRKMGLAERPTPDVALQLLRKMPAGKRLFSGDVNFISALLKKFPERIWNDIGHWLNLASQWVPISSLSFSLSKAQEMHWSHLHPGVKEKTADFRLLPGNRSMSPPFNVMNPLGGHLQERLNPDLPIPECHEGMPWLNQMGTELRRILLDDEVVTARVRSLGEALCTTVWKKTPGLEVIPYIDHTPAGTPRLAEVFWYDHVLYTDDLPKARLASLVPEVLGKAFRQPKITAAFHYCVNRKPEDVSEYLRETFKLSEEEVLATASEGDIESEVVAESEQDVKSVAVEKSPPVDEGLPVEASNNLPRAEVSPVPHRSRPVATTADQDSPARKLTYQPKASTPSLVERFARRMGFAMAEDPVCPVHKDRIVLSSSLVFKWEKRSAQGEINAYYFVKDHCLEHEPLQVGADVWSKLEKSPEKHSLILRDALGEPVEIKGTRLLEMLKAEQLQLYPASYRLVMSGAQ